MLILGIILFGMLAGAAGQLLTGNKHVNWSVAIVCGLIGAFVGGLLVSLIRGDGIGLHAPGIIGAVVGAVIVTAIYQWITGRKAETTRRR